MRELDHIFDHARALRRHIILPEGRDPRVVAAAATAAREGLADITLIDGEAPGAKTLDLANAADLDDLAQAYHKLRAHKGVTLEQAQTAMRDPIAHAAMRVRLRQAHGSVGGAVATTADTVRAALQIIGKAPNAGIVSSFFLMLPRAENSAINHGMIFSDCGLVISPSVAELADIALAAARSCRELLRERPRVAMLSFSTAGSADHPDVTRVREALALARARNPDLEIEGEMQLDAALDCAIRARKMPENRLTGPANVLVFPDLAAGNIGYKIAERIGGLAAVGPILQGLAHPANDLSRGCSVDDIVAAIAVTAVQAGEAAPR